MEILFVNNELVHFLRKIEPNSHWWLGCFFSAPYWCCGVKLKIGHFISCTQTVKRCNLVYKSIFKMLDPKILTFMSTKWVSCSCKRACSCMRARLLMHLGVEKTDPSSLQLSRVLMPLIDFLALQDLNSTHNCTTLQWYTHTMLA